MDMDEGGMEPWHVITLVGGSVFASVAACIVALALCYITIMTPFEVVRMEMPSPPRTFGAWVESA